MAEGINNLDIGGLLLKALEIDPEQEKKELLDGLVKRIQGLLDNLKMKAIRALGRKNCVVRRNAVRPGYIQNRKGLMGARNPVSR